MSPIAAGTVVRPLQQRFAEKYEIAESGCWLWTGFVDKAGYGRIRIAGRSDGGPAYAHRVSYELNVEPIPAGLVIDHLCRVRHCVNPAHLEVVTSAENVARGIPFRPHQARRRSAFCGRGHDQRKHGYERPDGRGTNCRECRRENRRAQATT